MNFDKESKSHIIFFCGVCGGEYNLSYGHVGIHRMIMHNDNPNQGSFEGGRGGRAGVPAKRIVVGGEFRALVLIFCHTMRIGN